MNKKFQEKLKHKQLYKDLQVLYEKVSELAIEMQFLENYCKAYSFKEGVYYFTPFVKGLKNLSDDIDSSLYKITKVDSTTDIKLPFSLQFTDDIVFDE